MSLYVESLYCDWKQAAVRIIERAGLNPVVCFGINLCGIDPSKEGDLVVRLNGRLLCTAANPVSSEGCEVYPADFRRGSLVFLTELCRGDCIWVQDFRALSEAEITGAERAIRDRGGVF